MEERVRPTRSGLFSIELMVAVGVFTLCAAICVGLFVRSERSSRDSADLIRAVSEAKRVAECYKAAGGDLDRTAELAGGSVDQAGLFTIDFDSDWEPVPPTSADSVFALSLEPGSTEPVAAARLRVAERNDSDGAEDHEILSWQVAAWEVTP